MTECVPLPDSGKIPNSSRRKPRARGCFIPLRFACGEAFQFDWSEDFARIAGKQVKLQIAQFKLAHSRAFVLRAYYQQKT